MEAAFGAYMFCRWLLTPFCPGDVFGPAGNFAWGMGETALDLAERASSPVPVDDFRTPEAYLLVHGGRAFGWARLTETSI